MDVSWTIKKAEFWRIDAFELWCWKRLSWESHVDRKEIKSVNTKGNQPWIFTGRTGTGSETPILWPPDSKEWLIRKNPNAGKDWRQEEKGTTEDEMAGWHHRLEGHEFEQAPGDGNGQGGLACCGPWGCKELDTTERLSTTTIHTHRTQDNHHNSREVYWVKKFQTFHTAWFHFYDIFETTNDKTTELENRFAVARALGPWGGGGGRWRVSYKRQWGGACCERNALYLDGIPVSWLRHWGLENHHHWEKLRKGHGLPLCYFLHLTWTYDYVKAEGLALF